MKLPKIGVPVEEVVKGCFCCKFDELINRIEKILPHQPDILMGEPVGSCTDFVAAVANPIKIHYRDAFTFAPFSTMVDPDRVRELLLKETDSPFPEEVAYLFEKQIEEADLVVLNKCDLLAPAERDRLAAAVSERFPKKDLITTSARSGEGMHNWLEKLLSGRPGALEKGHPDHQRPRAASPGSPGAGYPSCGGGHVLRKRVGGGLSGSAVLQPGVSRPAVFDPGKVYKVERIKDMLL